MLENATLQRLILEESHAVLTDQFLHFTFIKEFHDAIIHKHIPLILDF